MDAASTSRLEAAREYLGRGYMPLPVPRGEKRCLLDGWSSLRFTEDDLPEQFAGDGNIGLALGEASGWLVDVDLDCEEAIELAPQFLPATKAKTGRASAPQSHWWYIAPGAVTKKHSDPVTHKMIAEFRSSGQQTLVGPSIHPQGEPYDWLHGKPSVVDANHLAACVAALAAAVVKQRHPDLAARTPPRPTSSSSAQATFAPDDSMVQRASAYLAAMPPAISGQGGHSRTYAAATALVHGFGLSQPTATRLLKDEYNSRCEPPWSDTDLLHKVSDAASKQHDKPYGWLRDQRIDAQADRRTDDVIGVESQSMRTLRPCTDLGNAERLADAYSDRIRFCPDMGQWFEWDGKRWSKCTDGVPRYLAAKLARTIGDEARFATDPSDQRERSAWAVKSESCGRIDAAVSLAATLPVLSVRGEQLDADPWMLNVLNGTIDLRSGDLLPHRQELLMTKLAPVEYDPNAACPKFDQFLSRMLGGQSEVVDYTIGFLGMCLSADCSYQKLPILLGSGANGKSVLVDTILGILGDYGCVAPPDLLVCTGGREHATEIADLMGRRLVIVSETEQGASLKLQRMKQLTGDSMLKARFMRQDYFTFRRTHKTILVTNNRPVIREDSLAVWRRIVLVPFNIVIPESEQNLSSLTELIAEWPGILALLVKRCIAWQAKPLSPPAGVRDATTDYREREDKFGRFLTDRCDLGDGAADAFTPWKSLLEHYKQWCTENGESPLSSSLLADAFTKRGLATATKSIQGKSAKCRLGVRIRSDLFEEHK